MSLLVATELGEGSEGEGRAQGSSECEAGRVRSRHRAHQSARREGWCAGAGLGRGQVEAGCRQPTSGLGRAEKEAGRDVAGLLVCFVLLSVGAGGCPVPLSSSRSLFCLSFHLFPLPPSLDPPTPLHACFTLSPA